MSKRIFQSRAICLAGAAALAMILSATPFAAQAALGALNVVVNVTNDNGGSDGPGDFIVNVAGASSSPATFVGSSTGQAVTVEAGLPYVVSLSTLRYSVGYSPECVGSLAAGDQATCVINLNDNASLPEGQSAPNLIGNPSLEVQIGGVPTGWLEGNNPNAYSYIYPVPGIGGGVGAKTQISVYVDGDAKWYFAKVPVLAGHSYVFHDDYIAATSTELTAEYFAADGSHLSFGGFYSVPPTATDTWQTSGAVFTAPAGAAFMTVFHLINKVGSLTVDNFTLAEVPLPQPFRQGFVTLTFDDGLVSQYENAAPILDAAGIKGTFYDLTHLTAGISIDNQSLETASGSDPAHWLKSGSDSAVHSYPVAGHTGAKAADVSSTQAGSNGAWSFDPIAIVPDAVYAFNQWYKSTAESEVVALVTMNDGTIEQADVTDAAGVFIGPSLPLASTSDNWMKVSAHFYVPVGAKKITVLNRLQGIGHLAVDDVDFGASTYMDKGQLSALQALGHEIGSHSQSHRDLASLPADEALAEIRDSRLDLLGNGIAAVTAFNYPYGIFNNDIKQMAGAAGYTSGRTVISGFNGMDADKYALYSQSVNADTTLGQVTSWISQAVNDRHWLILVMHDVKTDLTGLPYGTTPAMLQSIVNYIDSANVPTRTVGQGLAAMDAAEINVTVSVVNNFGGTSTAEDFLIAVTGTDPQPVQFFGSSTATTTVSLSSGAYSIAASTSMPANYTASSSVGCSGTIAAGTAKSCAITFFDRTVVQLPVGSIGGGSGSDASIIVLLKASTTATSTDGEGRKEVLGVKVDGFDAGNYSSFFGAKSETVEILSADEATLVYESNGPINVGSKAQALYDTIVGGFTGVIRDSERNSMLYFIQFGTKSTKRLGMGERAGVLNSYKSAYGRFPQSVADWQDAIKVANGRWPKNRILAAENDLGIKRFAAIYRRLPNLKNVNDSSAVMIMTYGLLPVSRNVGNEAAATRSFRAYMKISPLSAAEWNLVRAIAYSGAHR